MTTHRMLAVFALLAACRSTAGGGLDPETDAGTADVVSADVPAMDAGATDVVTSMDRRCVPSGMENTNAACSDGIDNDCNGFFDCNDFACSRNAAVNICPDAGPPRDVVQFRDAQRVDSRGCMETGSENSATACGDGVDNDCDGFIDCNDRNCSCVGTCPGSVLGCTCSGPENTNTACGDGVDNDCNNFRDCNDFSCSRNAMVSVCPSDGGVSDSGPRDVVQFRDAVRADSAGCMRSGDENSPTACGDGMDNDCDGFVDCEDRNCSCQGTCPGAVLGCTCAGAENTDTACGDGVDNDCNNFRDCNDFSCSRNAMVSVCGRDGGARD